MKIRILVILFLSSNVFAKLPRTVPLMPPRDGGNETQNTKRVKWVEDSSVSSLLGMVEIGTLLRKDSTSSDLLGMQTFLGGRFSLRFPILSSSFYFRPSIGYFFKKQSEGAVSVLQHVVEGGLAAQYAVINRSQFQWTLGMANRLDLNISTISIYNQSTSAKAFRYRMGPSSGFQFAISPHLRFTTDLEATVSVDSSRRVFGAMTTGLAFDL